MSTTINTAGAKVYFAPENHIRADLWKSFSAPMQAAAVAQAKRMVSAFLQTDVEGETVDADSYYYPDQACYEQALFLLVNSDAVPNGELTGPKYLASDPETDSGARNPDVDLSTLCSAALGQLRKAKRRLTLLRG